ncbi:hypothetical protein J7I98_37965 [Streptomyces sp. ISL-98]|uniref:hypothetical protein n=1 Tax=Streptomyces sp. ISL-98 TaxID=2819192 RepID=UPI001BE87340|nr:hypothetical protein [Streptomyces sp. ISL-98]MBT2511484.1 hypothetical protein [Streptomyces sp. ISL-98]
MYSSLGFRSAHEPVPDSLLMREVQDGRLGAFRRIYRRHYSAVSAYAIHCADGPVGAYLLACRAFAELLQRILEGEPHLERRLAGCLRLQLLSSVRIAAVSRCAGDSEQVSPRFRQWVAQGARWSMEDNLHLALAWENLPADTRCLLWHTMADRDNPDLVSAVTGVPSRLIDDTRIEGLNRLRQIRVSLYLDRLERPDCRAAVEELMAQLPALRLGDALRHAGVCAACREVFNDVIHLDTRLEKQLPSQLLGWWPGSEYLNVKSSIHGPVTDPPFLDHTMRTTLSATRPRGSSRGRGAVGGGLRSALVIAAFVVGVAAGYASYSASAAQDAEYDAPAHPWHTASPR